MIFYNLAEFAFEYLRNSQRILAPLAKSFFLKSFFATWSYCYLDLARALAPVVLPLSLFFWHNKSVRCFSFRAEEGQPPMKDKGNIALDREELARGETTLWMKLYYLNIYFTQTQSQVQLVFIIFKLFSVNRRNQLENHTVVWAKIILALFCLRLTALCRVFTGKVYYCYCLPRFHN